ncbi:tyrosine-type recombinase/integrase [Desulfobulbus alkaliphilus]|uniref:tyrosine-type recombinase/integrase n=1 Tax=Desulfobulbus alkaliphilus TaxID=869814 RepID=UPI0019649BCE|nr:site-specific integrase [Desulfobulbus alkaliphilus]MBM9536197.1 site-specific integrase [Desulfobulbus alkaliphilus]
MEQERLTVSYETFYREQYEPLLVHKKPSTARGERILQRLWVLPVIGKRPIREVGVLDIERVKQGLVKAGRAPRTIEYTFAVIRMVINVAIQRGFYVGQNPIAAVKKMKFDNRRTRFLSHDEAEALLIEIAKRSMTIHNMALLALHTGLRLSEICGLCWSDVDLTHNVLTVRDTKSGKNRHVPMTERVRKMFQHIAEEAGTGALVFPSRKGELRKGPISNSFDKAVDALGFNEGVTDRRQKVTFHVLRHTCASWMAMAGVELYSIKEVLGHQSIQMTERYSHLCPSRLRAAIDTMENALNAQDKVVSIRRTQHG